MIETVQVARASLDGWRSESPPSCLFVYFLLGVRCVLIPELQSTIMKTLSRETLLLLKTFQNCPPWTVARWAYARTASIVMTQQGATLQNYNSELVACIEEVRMLCTDTTCFSSAHETTLACDVRSCARSARS